MKPLKIGLIGAGGVTRTLHAPLLTQFKDISLEWVFDARLDAARKVASSYAIPVAQNDLSLCPDVDAVLLAIPVGARQEAWQAAAKRRWHVLCEKPAACSVEELDAILSAMQQAGRVVSFGLMRRFYHGTLCLRELVRGRAFGDPLELWAGEGETQPRTGRGEGWYQLDRRLAGGGVLIETGSHLLDQLMFVTGASGYELDEYAEQSWQEQPEFDARVYGRLTVGPEAAMPFSCIVTRSADVCNGLFIRYPKVTLVLPPGPGGVVEIRDQNNRLVGHFHGAAHGALTSFQAFRDEWVTFLNRCRTSVDIDVVRDNRLVRLSVGLIEECYKSTASALEPSSS